MDHVTYIHQLPQWPQFIWDSARIGNLLAQFRYQQGMLGGRMEATGFDLRRETMLLTYTNDVIKSSEIEGEHLNYEQVRSSVARHLGLDTAGLISSPRDVDGVVEMVLDATTNYQHPLTPDRLFAWHSLLFPGGRSGFNKITIADWRKGVMQIVSGRMGKERIHFQAPSPEIVPQEMQRFMDWYNEDQNIDLVLKAGIAHIWFETIHPFDDGNGRIGRALCDLLLARSENTSKRFYSLSAQIQKEREDYYQHLEHTQKNTHMDITYWLEWYLNCLLRAVQTANDSLNRVFHKTHYWNTLNKMHLNERQRFMLNHLLDEKLYGSLTSTKWAKMCKCSQDSASRDIQDLIEKNILKKGTAGGRSTAYELVEIGG
ncbi:MAG: Fic family protein [Alphaproteobacteria bacterium]|nr:Fic family protein [Alphaproteobacteria bacterium]